MMNLEIEGVLYGIWRVEEDEETLKRQLSNPSHFGTSWLVLQSSKRRKEYLITRLIIKHLLGEEQIVCYRPDGSPFLNCDWNISISHSKQFVAVIVSKRWEIAMDIEEIANKAFRLQERFLTSSEQKLLVSNNINDGFGATLLWSAKETLYKISKSPLKSQFKEQIGVESMAENSLQCKVGNIEKYTLHFFVFEGNIVTFTYK